MAISKPSRAELRMLRQLIDLCDADIVLQQQQGAPMDAKDRLSARLAVESAVLDWHSSALPTSARCTAQVDDHAPVLPAWSPAKLGRAGRVAVVGPCPTYEEQERKTSPATRMLSTTMRQSGLAPDMVTWMHACWCFPAQMPGSKLSRGPRNQELDQWHPWLVQALYAADVDYVLLHGSHALRAWRHDLKLEEVAGGMYLWNQRWFVQPINHAVNAKRMANQKEAADIWQKTVDLFVERVLDDMGLRAITSEAKCRLCDSSYRQPFFAWDADGVGYCEEHFEKKMGTRKKAQEREVKNRAHQQGRLL